MPNPLLEAISLSKSYDGVPAIQDVSFTLMPGTIHALCGENGAGKSTLVKILMGIINKDGGEILVAGKKVNFHSPRQALHSGISIVEQELSPVPDMTVAENIFLGREGTGSNPFIDYRTLNHKAREILEKLNVGIDPRTKMKKLRVAQTQLVEIAKAISYGSDIIIMDEPTSAIGERETERLFEVLSSLRVHNKGIVFISHRIDEIFSISDEITILRDGRLVDHGAASEFDRDKLISQMIGRKLNTEYVKENIPQDEVVLEVKKFSRKQEFSDVNISVRKGEIFGIFGLMGSGRTEFLNALYGVTKADSGKIFIKGRETKHSSPGSNLRKKIAYVTEDRKDTGLVLSGSVGDNISIASLKSISHFGFVNRKLELSKISEMIHLFGIRTTGHNQIIRRLSGGNQQKVVLGKWILIEPSLLLLDEPTRGIDVGAKREIYRFMSEYSSKGNAIVMVSSELHEILGMSDRIAVFKEGHLVSILDRKDANQERLMSLAT